jgi:hypothetical protein
MRFPTLPFCSSFEKSTPPKTKVHCIQEAKLSSNIFQLNTKVNEEQKLFSNHKASLNAPPSLTASSQLYFIHRLAENRKISRKSQSRPIHIQIDLACHTTRETCTFLIFKVSIKSILSPSPQESHSDISNSADFSVPIKFTSR